MENSFVVSSFQWKRDYCGISYGSERSGINYQLASLLLNDLERFMAQLIFFRLKLFRLSNREISKSQTSHDYRNHAYKN